MQRSTYQQKLLDSKVVAVIRAESKEKAVDISKACLRGGINSIELTFTTPQAEQAIHELHEQFPDKSIGAGTVLEATTARLAINAGAEFIVSPAFDQETALLCNLYQVPYIPGCMTVSEIKTALSYGSSIIKLFPGGIYGPTAIKQFKGPLPQIEVMPSGGVDVSNVKEWFNAGAIAVSAGSSLTKGSLTEIEEKARQFMEAVTTN